MIETQAMDSHVREGEQGILEVCYKLLSAAIVDRLERREANSLITNFMLLLTEQRMDAYWMKLWVVYGIVWLTIMARLYFSWYGG